MACAMRMGTTSACAENTCGEAVDSAKAGNYLRVRGEYLCSSRRPNSFSELPPRARRIPLATVQGVGRMGTTSACAENTFWGWGFTMAARNYLRVRGEYPK